MGKAPKKASSSGPTGVVKAHTRKQARALVSKVRAVADATSLAATVEDVGDALLATPAPAAPPHTPVAPATTRRAHATPMAREIVSPYKAQQCSHAVPPEWWIAVARIISQSMTILSNSEHSGQVAASRSILSVWLLRYKESTLWLQVTDMLLKVAALLSNEQINSVDGTDIHVIVASQTVNQIVSAIDNWYKNGTSIGNMTHNLRNIGIAPWLIQLRHRIAHEPTSPSYDELIKALDALREFVFEYFWCRPDMAKGAKIRRNREEDGDNAEKSGAETASSDNIQRLLCQYRAQYWLMNGPGPDVGSYAAQSHMNLKHALDTCEDALVTQARENQEKFAEALATFVTAYDANRKACHNWLRSERAVVETVDHRLRLRPPAFERNGDVARLLRTLFEKVHGFVDVILNAMESRVANLQKEVKARGRRSFCARNIVSTRKTRERHSVGGVPRVTKQRKSNDSDISSRDVEDETALQYRYACACLAHIACIPHQNVLNKHKVMAVSTLAQHSALPSIYYKSVLKHVPDAILSAQSRANLDKSFASNEQFERHFPTRQQRLSTVHESSANQSIVVLSDKDDDEDGDIVENYANNAKESGRILPAHPLPADALSGRIGDGASLADLLPLDVFAQVEMAPAFSAACAKHNTHSQPVIVIDD